MKYTRLETTMNLFGMDIKVHRIPELPKLHFQRGGVKYSVTDLRVLNEHAVDAFEQMLKYVMEVPNCYEMKFIISDDTPNENVNLIVDIVTGISYSAKKGGKHGYETEGVLLAYGTHYEYDEQGHIASIKFDISKDNAKAIYEYAKKKRRNNEAIDYCDLVMAIADDCNRRLLSHVQEGEGIGNIELGADGLPLLAGDGKKRMKDVVCE